MSRGFAWNTKQTVICELPLSHAAGHADVVPFLSFESVFVVVLFVVGRVVGRLFATEIAMIILP